MSSFGNTGPLYMFPLASLVIMIITGIVVYLSELFFASRIYLLDKSSWWAAVISGLSATVSFVFFILTCRVFWKDPYFRNLASSQTRLSGGITLSFTVVAVTTVTVVLLMKLSSTHTSIKRTQKILHQLHLFLVTRGLLVILNSIAYFIVYEIQPHALYWVPFLHFGSKLHVISIVAMLNARSPPTQPFDAGITISVENYQNSDQVFNSFMRNPVANSSKSHSMHFASVPDEANNLVTH
ncbi:hypothetical protein L208DRAFT_1506237 [Tricholoma matsutake]|nr:hypothetical protein L208DRAFT_1506237 [Tricholoma matsutake 945]